MTAFLAALVGFIAGCVLIGGLVALTVVLACEK